MDQRTNKCSSLRVEVPKEVYNKFKVYAIKNNTNVSEMIRNYIKSVIKKDTIYFS
jgi:hypothetical protein